jgi:hypothetical protein
MEIRKTNVQLAYKIEEKPEGGFIARSDDASAEPIEGATKAELFEKMRTRSAELIGEKLPPDAGAVHTSDINFRNPRPPLNRGMNRGLPMRDPRLDPRRSSDPDAEYVSRGFGGWTLGKIMFFLLLALLVGWIVLRS